VRRFWSLPRNCLTGVAFDEVDVDRTRCAFPTIEDSPKVMDRMNDQEGEVSLDDALPGITEGADGEDIT